MPFKRKEATKQDLDRARELKGKIVALVGQGVGDAEVARAFRLPAAAVTAIIQESKTESPPTPPGPPPGAVDPPTIPDPLPGSWGLDVGRPILPTGTPVVADTITAEVERIVRLAGGNANTAALVAERFAFYAPNDLPALERILLESGATPATARSALGLYRERTRSTLADGDEPTTDETDDSPRDKLRELRRRRTEELELRLYEAEVKRTEREAHGEPPAAPAGESPELRALRGELTELREKLGRFELADAVARSTAPLAERLRALEGRQKLTFDDVEVQSYARSSATKNDAQAKVLDVIGDRFSRAPSLLELSRLPRGARLLRAADARLDALVARPRRLVDPIGA